jgi:hypothetical protein
MLDYKDIKMCISYMEREDTKEEDFYSGSCCCIMQRFVQLDDTIYNVLVYSPLTQNYHPIIKLSKREVQNW